MRASIYADVIGSRALDEPGDLVPTLGDAARVLNAAFKPSLAAPFTVDFGEEMRGALDDPVQAPLCVSVLREALAPLMVRVGVALDTTAHDAFMRATHEDRLICFEGTGEAGDLLLNAFCSFVDPLIRQRTPKHWEAVAAMRACGDSRAAAEKVGVTRKTFESRLKDAGWYAVEKADATVAAYLSALLMPAEL